MEIRGVAKGFDYTQTGIGTEPINRDDLREFIRFDVDKEQALMERMLKAVRVAIENYANISLVKRTISAYWEWVPSPLPLPFGPIASVDSVAIVDKSDGTETSWTVDEDYWVEGVSKKKVHFMTSPEGYGVKIGYKTALPDDSTMALAREVILAELADWWENRGSFSDANIYSVSSGAKHRLNVLRGNTMGI